MTISTHMHRLGSTSGSTFCKDVSLLLTPSSSQVVLNTEMIQGDDQPAVKKNGFPAIGLNGRRQKTYGWASSHFLAVHKFKGSEDEKNIAIPNPDNFALFALAVYLDNFWWGTGYAKSQPEKLAPQRRDMGNTTLFVA